MNGLERFIADLSALGRECERRNGLVVVTLDVERPDLVGPLQVGADPPNEFPNLPPHWLHAPRQLAIPGGSPQASELGPDWLKWSRTHPKWKGGANAATLWLAHARSLVLAATKV
jgi:hypothetical protein